MDLLKNPNVLHDETTASIELLLKDTIICEGRLRNLASKGIPDNCGVRGIIWRILLEYLPYDQSLWESITMSKREAYKIMSDHYNKIVEKYHSIHGDFTTISTPEPSPMASTIHSGFTTTTDTSNNTHHTLSSSSSSKQHINALNLTTATANMYSPRRSTFLLDSSRLPPSHILQKTTSNYYDTYTDLSKHETVTNANNTRTSMMGTTTTGNRPSLLKTHSVGGRQSLLTRHSTYHLEDSVNYTLEDTRNSSINFSRLSLLNINEEDLTIHFKLLEEIEKDVTRTHPNINYFIQEVASRTVLKSLERVLYIFAYEHPYIGYIQGMNDVLGILLYVFGNDENEEWSQHSEADAYHCFTTLMMIHQDMYQSSLDDTNLGIHLRLHQFMQLLLKHDPIVYDHLKIQHLDPSYFGFRWLTTFFSREFNIADTIVIWDSLLADINQIDFMSYFAMTMITEQRTYLLSTEHDFGNNLYLLQNYPNCDLQNLIQQVYIYRNTDYCHQLNEQNNLIMSMSGISDYAFPTFIPTEHINYEYFLDHILFPDNYTSKHNDTYESIDPLTTTTTTTNTNTTNNKFINYSIFHSQSQEIPYHQYLSDKQQKSNNNNNNTTTTTNSRSNTNNNGVLEDEIVEEFNEWMTSADQGIKKIIEEAQESSTKLMESLRDSTTKITENIPEMKNNFISTWSTITSLFRTTSTSSTHSAAASTSSSSFQQNNISVPVIDNNSVIQQNTLFNSSGGGGGGGGPARSPKQSIKNKRSTSVNSCSGGSGSGGSSSIYNETTEYYATTPSSAVVKNNNASSNDSDY